MTTTRYKAAVLAALGVAIFTSAVAATNTKAERLSIPATGSCSVQSGTCYDSTNKGNQGNVFVAPSGGGGGSGTNIGVVSESDAALASITTPYALDRADVTFYNSAPPLWFDGMGTRGALAAPLYEHVARIYARDGTLLQTVRFGAFGGALYGRVGGKDCGYYDCQRGYTDYSFAPTGDPSQAKSYPAIDSNSTATLTLYDLPPLVTLTFGTEFTIQSFTSVGSAPTNLAGPLAAQGGARICCQDTRYVNPIHVNNQSTWKADYVVTGTAATTTTTATCPVTSYTYGGFTPNCKSTAPSAQPGASFSDNYTQSTLNYDYTCTTTAVCQTDYTQNGAPAKWVVTSVKETQKSNNTPCPPPPGVCY